ncbi:hypothetical protein I3760_03G148100 [Carya illinoinensis]|nr:hypothetical protein I3760_03G148100 [Carya illinoinensis]
MIRVPMTTTTAISIGLLCFILFLSSHKEQYRIYFSGCFATYNSPPHFPLPFSFSCVHTHLGQFVKLEVSLW